MPLNPKSRDENAKNKDWQVPVNREGASPEAYPDRKTGETRKDKRKPGISHS